MKERVITLLNDRGVRVDDIAEIVFVLQRKYLPELTMAQCVSSVEAVLEKREAQHAILTGVAIDMMAEQGELPAPLDDIIRRDEPLYGVDEILALAITNIYGSVGLTSFGYLDKRKLGVIGRINKHAEGRVHTFLDDLVAGVAAAAAARLAHQFARESPADASVDASKSAGL